MELCTSRRDKDWSLTDCISFVVMNAEGIGEALTADHHFEQAGFEALLLVAGACGRDADTQGRDQGSPIRAVQRDGLAAVSRQQTELRDGRDGLRARE
jgi:hypothetical protein